MAPLTPSTSATLSAGRRLPLITHTSAHMASATAGLLRQVPLTLTTIPGPPVSNCWYTPPCTPVPLSVSSPPAALALKSPPSLRTIHVIQPDTVPEPKSPFTSAFSASAGAPSSVRRVNTLR